MIAYFQEQVALKGLSTNKDLIQKSDKGNSVVLLNRNYYFKQINEILYDKSFKKLDIRPGKEIRFFVTARGQAL